MLVGMVLVHALIVIVQIVNASSFKTKILLIAMTKEKKKKTHSTKNKWKWCKIYTCIPGGSSLCANKCSKEQIYKCFKNFEADYNKENLPK